MVANSMLKQELDVKLEQLPAHKLQEVLDFVSFLLFQARTQSQAQIVTPEQQLDDDPLQEFIGAVSHGGLTQGIDAEVYGV